jgi:hypothetical protein
VRERLQQLQQQQLLYINLELEVMKSRLDPAFTCLYRYFLPKVKKTSVEHKQVGERLESRSLQKSQQGLILFS